MAGMESIYSLIPQPVPPVIKPDRYLSKHPGNKPPTFSTFGLTGTSKPGYQNVAGAENSLKEGPGRGGRRGPRSARRAQPRTPGRRDIRHGEGTP